MPDGGSDAPAETSTDAGNDAATDAGNDAATDASNEVSTDAALDAGADAALAACTDAFTLDGPNITAQIQNDGIKPSASDFSGGTIESGTYLLTAALHHGSQYGGFTQQTLIFDMAAKKLTIGSRYAGTPGDAGWVYQELDIVFPDAVTLAATSTCCSDPGIPSYCAQIGQFPFLAWWYTFSGTGTGATISWSSQGSEDVETFTKQ
jgi:hypothetical protein